MIVRQKMAGELSIATSIATLARYDWCGNPLTAETPASTRGSVRVSEGTRTPDRRDHNMGWVLLRPTDPCL